MTQHSSAAFGAGGGAFSEGSRGVPMSACLPHQDTSLPGRSAAGRAVPKAGGLTAASLSNALAKGTGHVVPVMEAPIQQFSLTC